MCYNANALIILHICDYIDSVSTIQLHTYPPVL